MASINKKVLGPQPLTAEGAPASRVNYKEQLRRSVLTNFLWEDSYYEDGIEIADRIASLVPKVKPADVAALAIEAREKMKLRHMPLWLLRNMVLHAEHRPFVREALTRVIQRVDELTEFLVLYDPHYAMPMATDKQPLAACVKKGIGDAFRKFDEYQFAKYNRDGGVKLRDAILLTHPKPVTPEQAKLYKKILEGTLKTPNTWEVRLSGGEDKAKVFTDLINANKLGGLAMLRNLRNMFESGVDVNVIRKGLREMNTERILPFRFVAAAKYGPKVEPEIEAAMNRCISAHAKLPGKTILVVDTSGSMYGHGNVSKKSDITRVDAAAALAMLIREISEEPVVYATAGNDASRIHATGEIPARRGFALRDLIANHKELYHLGGGGIFLTQCMGFIYGKEKSADRVIVITDEQDCDDRDSARAASKANAFGKHNYIINISVEKNGIGYGKWTKINGWSEAVIDYIMAYEGLNFNDSLPDQNS